MLDNKENFPRDINVYLNYYSFKDKDKVYTNGIDLIPLSRVQTAVEHYIEEIKNKYKRKIVITKRIWIDILLVNIKLVLSYIMLK